MARARRVQELLEKNDRHLLKALVEAREKDMLYITKTLFPQDCPEYGGAGCTSASPSEEAVVAKLQPSQDGHFQPPGAPVSDKKA